MDAHAVVEIADEGERQDLPMPVTWVHRDSGADLRTALRAIEFPAEGTVTWVTGGAGAVRRVRVHLTWDRGIDPARVHATGYWRRGSVGNQPDERPKRIRAHTPCAPATPAIPTCSAAASHASTCSTRWHAASIVERRILNCVTASSPRHGRCMRRDELLLVKMIEAAEQEDLAALERQASWGRIVGLTSGSPMGFPGEVTYGAAKAALENYTMAASVELGKRGVTANMVYPPVTDTGWVTEEVRDFVSNSDDHIHVAQPDDVARVIAFLCSNDAQMVTGNIVRMR